MHLEEGTYKLFLERNSDEEEWIRLLEHIGTCGCCAGALDSRDPPHQAPAYLKEQMMERVQRLDVQTAVTVRRTSKRMQLFLYGLKTAAAVLAALLMLFTLPSFEHSGEEQGQMKAQESVGLTRQMNKKSKEVTELLNQFSSRLINGGNVE